MQKQYLTLTLALVFSFFSEAQINSAPENPQDCGQYSQQEKIYKLKPQQKAQDSIDGVLFEQEYRNYLATYDPNQRSTFTVPVVVHVVHLNGDENISNNQIYNAIEKLNEDFSMTNSDLVNTYPAFTGVIGNGDIEFKLATIDPNGNCHSGITRTVSGTSFDTGMGGGGHPIVDAVAAEHGVWPQGSYMSVFVCSDPAGNAGYTYNPSNFFNSAEMYGAIFMRHDYMGEIGTSMSSRKHVLSHEAGHWLNLSHVWGSTNNPNVPSNCNADDGVGDTPNTLGSQGCLPTSASCGSVDNIQNIMEYSSCRTMFTQGQAARMQTSLNSNTAGRSNLINNFNLIATGVDLPAPLCEAEFISSEQVICTGEAINFADMSFHSVTSRSWTFTGGSPASSSDSAVSVTYSTAGSYEVSIDVSDGAGNIVKSLSNYITVFPSTGSNLPIAEGFETIQFPDYSTFLSTSSNGLSDWNITPNVGSSSSKSVFYNNYANGIQGAEVSFESSTIDLGSATQADDIILSFDFAYRKKESNNNEELRVYISKDCGESWSLRKSIFGNNLSSQTDTSPFLPSSNDWQSTSVTNISSSYLVSNFRYKFVFESDEGNNIYIDNINIFPEAQLGLLEKKESDHITLYPNPIRGELNISLVTYQLDSYQIMNARGQLIELETQPQLNIDRVLTIQTGKMTSGIYYITLVGNNEVITKKFIKQ
ncbi:MAG: M43 family zinc metalloprotease [Crocinitomicaceae bacterium]